MTAPLHEPVLVVDDEAPIRDLIAAMLRRDGREVLTAASAEEALLVAGANPVALVISDYSLGPKSGLELLGELRAERLEVPFVLASVLFPAEVPERARRAGAQLVIDKGELLDDLTGLVEGLVIQ